MISLANWAFEPSCSHQDRVLYVTSSEFHSTICSDNVTVVVDKIKALLTASDTRLEGLEILEVAVQQNSDVYLKANWPSLIFAFLKDDDSGAIVKDHSCRALTAMMPFMSKDPAHSFPEFASFFADLCFLLMKAVSENTMWIEAASRCLHACAKNFPKLFRHHVDDFVKIFYKQLPYCVSSNTFEVLCECFTEIPNCYMKKHDKIYKEEWDSVFLLILSTLMEICPFSTPEDTVLFTRRIGSQLLSMGDEENEDKTDIMSTHFRAVCKFINLSKICAKLLTMKTKFMAKVPVNKMLHLITGLFNYPEKMKPATIEMQLHLSTISHLQCSGLLILEGLMHNINLRQYAVQTSNIIFLAMKAAKLPSANEYISELRLATWKLMNLWFTIQGSLASDNVAAVLCANIEELLNDISCEAEEELESFQLPPQKSKKISTKFPKTKSCYVKKNSYFLCKEALKLLESLVYRKKDMDETVSKKIYDKIIQVSYDINEKKSFPYPYDDASCRKNLYNVLLALVTVSKPGNSQNSNVSCAAKIFQEAMVDPSPKISKLYYKAIAIFNLKLGPVKSYAMHLKARQRKSNVLKTNKKEILEEAEFKNLPAETVPEIPERIRHNSNEHEMHTEEYNMEVETDYSEQIPESQYNRGEVLQVQTSNQDQEEEDEVNNDEASAGEEEEVEEEEEEEDDGGDDDGEGEGDGDDDIEEDEEDEDFDDDDDEEEDDSHKNKNPFVPNKGQILNPVHNNQEAIIVQEFDSLNPCGRTETNIVNNSKNMQFNGMHCVSGENINSSCEKNIANENGIYIAKDADNEQKRGIDEEEEITFPSERKVQEICDPPTKRQKIETNEADEDFQTDERDSRSPTLSEMKADFIYNEVEDVKS